MRFTALLSILVVLLPFIISDDEKKRIRIRRYVKKSVPKILNTLSQPQTETENKKKIRIKQYIKRYDAKEQRKEQEQVPVITDDINEEVKQESQAVSNLKATNESLEKKIGRAHV